MPYLKMKTIHHSVSSNQFFNDSNDRAYPFKRQFDSNRCQRGEHPRKNSKRWVNLILRILIGTGCLVAFELSYALCSGKNCSCSVEVMPVNFGNYSPFQLKRLRGWGRLQ